MFQPIRPFQAAKPDNLQQLSAGLFAGDALCRCLPLGESAAWVSGTESDGTASRFLVRPFPGDVAGEDFFNPLEVHGLAFEFAAVPHTEVGFLSFARRYGFLGVPRATDENPPQYLGECWTDWQDAHAKIGAAVNTLRYVESGQEPVELRADGTPCLGTARAGIIGDINENLKSVTSMRVVWSDSKQRHELRAVPLTLLGAMWWQVARLFVGEVSYTRCKVCGKYMERGPREAGTAARMANAVFCSATCRSRGHRMRAKAHALRSAGAAISDIAKHLTTDEATVNEWLVS
ncbi:unnamed protein product [Gemmataceae bacterium]|nr:unnamed protein product [Gemmataceae bacterium]VTT99079.1 unnamed protein product [Gemmataceae bacterium]